jgi:hypothetical protein
LENKWRKVALAAVKVGAGPGVVGVWHRLIFFVAKLA